MIKPIKNSVSFSGNGFEAFQKSLKQGGTPAETIANNTPAVQAVQEAPKKVSLKEGILNIFKGYNQTTGVASGVVRGIADGAVLAGCVGFVGRNIKKANGNIGGTIAGMFKDTGKIIRTVFEHKPITSLITKSPLENLKTLKSVPVKFYKSCMKGNKLTSFAVVGTMLGAIAIRTLQGKLIANKKNADIDHYTNTKH